jgi:hypothetical protein
MPNDLGIIDLACSKDRKVKLLPKHHSIHQNFSTTNGNYNPIIQGRNVETFSIDILAPAVQVH